MYRPDTASDAYLLTALGQNLSVLSWRCATSYKSDAPNVHAVCQLFLDDLPCKQLDCYLFRNRYSLPDSQTEAKIGPLSGLLDSIYACQPAWQHPLHDCDSIADWQQLHS